MKSFVLLLILLAPTAESAPLERLAFFHVERFSAAGCAAALKTKDEYKPMGVCIYDEDGMGSGRTWMKSVVVGTVITTTGYTDNACTTACPQGGNPGEQDNVEATASCFIGAGSVRILNSPEPCQEYTAANPSYWWKGALVTNVDSGRASRPYTDNACTTQPAVTATRGNGGTFYNVANICKQNSATTSEKAVCTATLMTVSTYMTKDCSGPAVIATAWGGVTGDVCFADPGPVTGHAGTFKKQTCNLGTTGGGTTGGGTTGGGTTSGGTTGSGTTGVVGSTSKAWRVCSYGLVQLLVGAALAAVMNF